MAEQIFQVGIKALVRNEEGEVLMLRVPEMSGNAAHWDLPGGRMDPGESFLQTLGRELREEIGTSYITTPQQLMAVLTRITIAVDDIRIPLIFVVYEVTLPAGAEIKLDVDSNERAYKWFAPLAAADEMAFKFTDDFCELVRGLKN